MIAIYKNKKNSKSKTIKLFKYIKSNKNNKIGIYNSYSKLFFYNPTYLLNSLKLGNKISKNLIKLLINNLKH
uniref:30S ribosomal protein S16 n=1 Tax=Nephromyces sp. ex Molgula occidentalis TaxID=2544991 RepID=A0A5C1H935_9APIC|nr:hypothetical protein [Nephromyces sp. ex Molgula occidentalis]